jgi:hypothetical protein
LRHRRRKCADQTSVPSAGNKSKMTPAQQAYRQL